MHVLLVRTVARRNHISLAVLYSPLTAVSGPRQHQESGFPRFACSSYHRVDLDKVWWSRMEPCGTGMDLGGKSESEDGSLDAEIDDGD